MITLAEVFKRSLMERGINRVGSLSKRFRKSRNVFQDMGLAVYYGEGIIAKLPEPTTMAWDLSGRIVSGSNYAYVPSCMANRFKRVLTSEALASALPEWPKIVIDLSFWDRHTPKEKKKLCLQITQAYGLVKNRFTGRELVVTNVGEEFKRLFYGPLKKLTIYRGPTWEYLKKEGIERIVLLDPWAERDLSEKDLREKAFVIGGIVDMGGSKRKTTPKIGEALEVNDIQVLRRRISLRGNVVGVPDRINRIVGIILDMMKGLDMERAVYINQEPLHARWRLRVELPKCVIMYRIDGRDYRVLRRKVYEEYSKWLKIRWKDFVKVLREIDIVALDDKRIQKLNKRSTPVEIKGRIYRVIDT